MTLGSLTRWRNGNQYGNHRIAKARRDSVVSIPARRIGCPEPVPFLTSTLAFESYVEYWNSKIKETRAQPRRASLTTGPKLMASRHATH